MMSSEANISGDDENSPKPRFMIIAAKNTEKRKVEGRVSGNRNQRNVRGIIPKKSYNLSLISPKVLIFYDLKKKLKSQDFCLHFL